jgi:hypothetical protein
MQAERNSSHGLLPHYPSNLSFLGRCQNLPPLDVVRYSIRIVTFKTFPALNPLFKRAKMPSDIPSIDFSRFSDGSSEGRQNIASEIDSALKGVGCFFLRGHGIQQSRIDTWFGWVNLRYCFDLKLPILTAMVEEPALLRRPQARQGAIESSTTFVEAGIQRT